MRKINKGVEPASLVAFKQGNNNATYINLTYVERQDIRTACVSEQFYLCAYCCSEIYADKHSCHNEHVEAQTRAPNRTLDCNNIVASCNNKNQCGDSHESEILPLTPLMDECETELKFYLSGRVEGLSDQARESIKVLNLGDNEQNNRFLIQERKYLVEAVIYSQCEDPADIQLLEDNRLKEVIDSISNPQNGKLMPYSPVLKNILKGWLAA